MKPMDGRWIAGEYQWACPVCSAALCSKDAPTTFEAAQCNGCRAEWQMCTIGLTVSKLTKECRAWRDRAIAAEAEVARWKAEAETMIALARKTLATAETEPPPDPANDVH